MSPNVWTLNTQTGRGTVAKCQCFTQNVECLSPSSFPPLWKMLVLHATLSGDLRLCLSLTHVLSGARLGMTRLYCLEAAGGLSSSPEWTARRGKEGGEALWGVRGWHEKERKEKKGTDTLALYTHLLATPSAHTSPFVLFTLHKNTYAHAKKTGDGKVLRSAIPSTDQETINSYNQTGRNYVSVGMKIGPCVTEAYLHSCGLCDCQIKR